MSPAITQNSQGSSRRQGVTNGLPRDPSDNIVNALMVVAGTPRDLRYYGLELVLELEPPVQSNNPYLYSNLGYMMLGAVSERVANLDWEHLVEDRIFFPLNMTTAGVGYPPTSQRDISQPWGHTGTTPVDPFDAVLTDVEKFLHPAINPACGVHCSIGDFVKFVNWHLQGERSGDNSGQDLLTKDSLQR